MTSLVGHDATWREWRAAMASTRMHHGWILAGPKGSGKGHFARAAAAELVAHPGVPQPPVEGHPDILVLEALPASDEDEKKRAAGQPHAVKRSISVDQVRRMETRLFTRPTLGPRRAVIIDTADELEKSAVNALLKALEEPPAGTFFVLISHRPGRLLPTVRSRCRVLRFPRLEADAVDAILRAEAPQADAAARAAAIAAAEGSPGMALQFVEQQLGGIHALMRRILHEGDPGFALRGALAGEIGARPARERIAAALDLARAALAGELRDAPRDRQLAIIAAHGEVSLLAAQAQTYNFDNGLLIMEIGGLLASAAMPREAAS